jgi:hemerythrin
VAGKCRREINSTGRRHEETGNPGAPMHIDWNPRLSIGLDEIDQQHQGLFGHVNVLLNLMWSHAGKPEIDRSIAVLAAAVSDHFRAEEQLMRAYSYPLAVDHAAEHGRFAQIFSDLQEEYESTGLTNSLTVRVNRFVCTWLLEHLSEADRDIGEFVRTGYATGVRKGPGVEAPTRARVRQRA